MSKHADRRARRTGHDAPPVRRSDVGAITNGPRTFLVQVEGTEYEGRVRGSNGMKWRVA